VEVSTWRCRAVLKVNPEQETRKWPASKSLDRLGTLSEVEGLTEHISSTICEKCGLNVFMNNGLQNKTVEKPAKFVFETVADIDHLEEINNFIEKSLKELDIQGEYYGHICVSLDEAVTNVVMYAYPKTKGNVRITIERLNDRVLMEIIDSGDPFNPLDHPVPDVSVSIEKRMIGGLGIHLMRNMMDELNYRRIGDKNCLSLVKHIGGS